LHNEIASIFLCFFLMMTLQKMFSEGH